MPKDWFLANNIPLSCQNIYNKDTMRAFIRKQQKWNISIVDLTGEVDFASAEPFREVCTRELSQKNIVFNLKNLRFVGSDGLSSFMETMNNLQQTTQLKFCCVSSEFRQVFADNSQMKNMDIYEDEETAVTAFHPCPSAPE